MYKPIISIVFVNYNVGQKLLKAVNSINKSDTKESFEIIVVENGNENLEKKLRKFKNLTYTKSQQNLGFGAGNNLGAKHAKGKYLLFLNPDTIVTKGSIDFLIKFYKSTGRVGIISPLLVGKSLKPFNTQSKKELTPMNAILSFSFLRKLFPGRSIYNDKEFYNWDLNTPLKVEAIPGAALLISKNLFNKAGGFDEKFFLYFEENDLSKRVKRLGFDLYIVPQAKIIHEVGQSTKKIENINKIFEKSRFLFLKKHYGAPKALITEAIIRFNPSIFLAIVISFFLRTYNIFSGMPFIGDFAWFYISARDMLLTENIPLVGITSSHVWLHQGPLWTYILSLPLLVFKFNPFAGVFVTILTGVASTYLIYRIVKTLYSKKAGIISSFLYATSPLIVYSDRTPYHTSLIPFFVLLYFYSLVLWVKGKKEFFPLSIFLIVILYNLELATFILFFPFALLFLLGVYKKKNWVLSLKNRKIVLISIFSFVLPMFPILIYDLSNGFRQTIVFLGWTFYKPVSALISGFSLSSGSVVNFLLTSITKIVFYYSFLIAVLLVIFSLFFLLLRIFKSKNRIENSSSILMLLILFSLTGIVINKTPSDAYLPMTFPLIIVLVSTFLAYLASIKNKTRYLFYFLVSAEIILNASACFEQDKSKPFEILTKNVDKITKSTKPNEFNLVGRGPGSQFDSFTMNYEYLLWLRGHFPSSSLSTTMVIIEESGNKIEIVKK